MATEKRFKFDDQDPLKAGPQDPASGGAAGGAAGGGMGAQQPTTPSGRPNVQQYLGANQGAGEKLAGNIQNNVQRDVNAVSKNVAQAKSDFENKANPLNKTLGEAGSANIGMAFKDPAALLAQEKVTNQPQYGAPVTQPPALGGQGDDQTMHQGSTVGLGQQPQPADQTSQNPSQFNLEDWKKFQSGGYGADIGNLGKEFGTVNTGLENQYGNLNKRIGQAGNETGRFDLLRSSLGQPNYTAGQQKLDQLFLQGQKGVAKNLERNLQTQGKGAQGELTAAQQGVTSALGGLNTSAEARKKQIADLLSGGTSADLESNINERGLGDIAKSSASNIAKAKADIANVPGLRERLEKNTLTAKDMTALGLQAGTKLYDVDMNKFINQQDPASITAASVSDPAEFARYRALQQLSGDTSGDIYGGAKTAGGFKPYDFRGTDLQNEINARTQAYEADKFKESSKDYGQMMANLGGSRWQDADWYRQNWYHGGQGGREVSSADDLQNMLNNIAQSGISGEYAGLTPEQRYQHVIAGGEGYGGNMLKQMDAYLKDLYAKRGRTIQESPEDIENTPVIK